MNHEKRRERMYEDYEEEEDSDIPTHTDSEQEEDAAQNNIGQNDNVVEQDVQSQIVKNILNNNEVARLNLIDEYIQEENVQRAI